MEDFTAGFEPASPKATSSAKGLFYLVICLFSGLYPVSAERSAADF
jgi:hypothetical protein